MWGLCVCLTGWNVLEGQQGQDRTSQRAGALTSSTLERSLLSWKKLQPEEVAVSEESLMEVAGKARLAGEHQMDFTAD